MTAQALRAALGGTPAAAAAPAPRDLVHLMASPGMQAQIKAALPRHMTAERMARIAMTELRKVPKLQQCDPLSFVGAVIQCAQLGLEPGNALGHAYILPYEKRKRGSNGQWQTERVEAQVIIGYRGMIDLARRSGQVLSLDAQAVYEGDTFECELGLDAKLRHVPDWNNANRADASKLRFVYAVAKLRDGGVQFAVMARAEIDAIRARSKAANDGPWVSDYAAMALKTVIRRLFKYLPVSVEIARAVMLDEQGDDGLQDNASVLTGELAPEPEPEPAAEPAAPAAAEQEKPPLVTEAEVAGRLRRAMSREQLDEAASMIGLVPDEKARAKLTALYESLSAAAAESAGEKF